MDPITLIALALIGGLSQVVTRLLEKGVIDPALEPATGLLKKWLQRGYRRAENDKKLLNAIRAALESAGAPAGDEDRLLRWLQQVGLDRLTAESNDALRRQVARGVLAYDHPDAEPPQDLMIALGWPRSRKRELAGLLYALRGQLSALDAWRAPIEYADRAAGRGLLRDVLDRLAQLDRVYVQTEAGQALRVSVARAGLTEEEAAAIEARYREDLVAELEWHDFRGIVQVKRDLRLPLADIYQELGLLRLDSEEERREAQERLLALRQEERVAQEERRLEQRVSDALARSPRLVVLGEPGAGKSISLSFVTLILAHGYGAARLGLDAPYIPLMVRLADYARELEGDAALGLDKFLLSYVERAYIHPGLGEFMRHALDRGACMVLLDGLDEVGDDVQRGPSRRTRLIGQVQRFADRWCADREAGRRRKTGQRSNRVVVTSRIEGYWDEQVAGFDHVQLSPLRPPDEVEAFLVRWYTAHELSHGADEAQAEAQARARVGELLPRVLEWPSVRRLATNPLLLTILALIHENVGRCQQYARRYRYVLQCDLRQFFPSIDHAILKRILGRVIADAEVMALIDRILESGEGVLRDEYEMVWFPGDDLFAATRPRSLPIGNLTSQFWANCYLDPFDQFVKRELRGRGRSPGYLRYVDDFLLYADDKATLWGWRSAIVEFLARQRLTIHPGAHPRPVTEGIPFLGFVVYPTHRRLKRRNVVNYRRRLRRVARAYRAGQASRDQVRASIVGWINHARYGDTWGLRRAMFSDIVL